jgi:phosphatidylglycerophosphate synthase
LNKVTLPWAITALRIIVLPLLIYSFIQEIQIATYILYLFSVSTDCLDGYLAKKFETTSTLGSYFDVTADFIFVSGMFLVFIFDEFYPSWIILFIILVFAQFMLTNVYSKRTIYDPLGKYYGSLMYGGIGLTFLSQEKLMLNIVTVGVTVSTIAVIMSRTIFLLVQYKNP